MKFTGFEAAAIEPMVANSPILFWLYDFLSVQAVSNLIGVIEITAAVLLATRPWSATAGILGGRARSRDVHYYIGDDLHIAELGTEPWLRLCLESGGNWFWRLSERAEFCGGQAARSRVFVGD